MSTNSVGEYVVGEQEQDLDLRHFWSVLRKRRMTFVQVFTVVVLVGVAATVLSKPLYRTQVKLLVPASASTVSVINSDNPIAAMMAAAQPDNISTQLQVLQSKPFLQEAREQAKIPAAPGDNVIPPSVKVQAVRDTNVIEITVEGGDPRAIARFANKIADLHLERTDLLRTTGLGDTLAFMREEVREAKLQLGSVTRQLLSFRTTHRVGQMDAQQEAEANQYIDAQTRLIEAENNIASTKAQISRLQARVRELPADTVQQRLQANPQRARLEEKLRELKFKRVELLQDFLPGSDQVVALDEQIAAFEEQLRNEPDSVSVTSYTPNSRRETLEQTLTALEAGLLRHEETFSATAAQVSSLRDRLGRTGPGKLQYETLVMERERAQARYNSLSDRLQELEIREKARGPMARTIEPATVPTSPIQPKPVMNVALSLVIGLLLGVGVAFLQEYLDDRINDPEDVERLVALPSLGHVPLVPEGEAAVVSALPTNSNVAEAYRSVRSSIQFAGLDGPVRRLQVTSASKGEGKTLTSVNLAMAMAMDGKRVILVDADLRRPNVHRVLNLPTSPGLSEVLVGMCRLEDALQETNVPNLRVLCAGTIPPNPAELLGASVFDHMMEQLDEQADVVIYDTPPCMPVTDPLLVASRVDGVVLVVDTGQTRRSAMKQITQLLGRARARIIGVVFNRVDARKGGHYYHYYYQYYGDGYYSEPGQNGAQHENGRRRAIAPRFGSTGSTVSAIDSHDEDDA